MKFIVHLLVDQPRNGQLCTTITCKEIDNMASMKFEISAYSCGTQPLTLRLLMSFIYMCVCVCVCMCVCVCVCPEGT